MDFQRNGASGVGVDVHGKRVHIRETAFASDEGGVVNRTTTTALTANFKISIGRNSRRENPRITRGPPVPYKTKTTFITNPTFNEEQVIVDAEGNRTILKENVLSDKVWTLIVARIVGRT